MGKLIDITGMKFGRLTVIERAPSEGHGAHAKWKCICDCGKTTITTGRDLINGHTVSCGCYCRENNSRKKIKNLTGQKFGRLFVLRYVGSGKQHQSLFECICDCGNIIVVKGGNLVSGNSKSCGCLKKEILSANNRMVNTTHRMTRTRLYIIWTDMKQRCNNKNDPFYYLYGGQGIKVCEEWKENFVLFYDWAVNNGYADNLTIDRIDNKKGYNPENCRWVTIKENMRNRRKCVYLTINGERKNVSAWCELYDISPNTVYGWVKKGEDYAVEMINKRNIRNSGKNKEAESD